MSEYLNTLVALSFGCFLLDPGLYLSLGSWRPYSRRRRLTIDLERTAYQQWMYLTMLKNLQNHTGLAISPPPPLKTYAGLPHPTPRPSPPMDSIGAANWFLGAPRPTTTGSGVVRLVPHSSNQRLFSAGFFKAKRELLEKRFQLSALTSYKTFRKEDTNDEKGDYWVRAR